ncbi:hypothetical protein JCM10207_002745 [Rhodosporidiobolus poonsookiae]
MRPSARSPSPEDWVPLAARPQAASCARTSRPPGPSSNGTDSSDAEDDDDDDDQSSVGDWSTPLLPQWIVRKDSGRQTTAGGFPLAPSASQRSQRKSRRRRQLAQLAYTSTLLCFALTCLFALVVLGWAASFLYQRHNSAAQAVFSPPMIPEPKDVEGRVEPFPRWMGVNATSEAENPDGSSAVSAAELERFVAVQRELDDRLLSLGLPESTALPCVDLNSLSTLPSTSSPFTSSRQASLALDPSSSADALVTRYSPLKGVGTSSSHARAGPTLIGINLYNSELVLPSLSRTLLSVARFLGPSTLHVSIFENGSTDNTTSALAHLAAALTALGTPHTIVSDPRKTDWKRVDRIDQLAVYRNVALAPLQKAPYSTTNPPADVVMINDVFTCPADLFELVFQRKVQEADAACGLDWRRNKGWAGRINRSVKFYDNWVTRSITGHLLRFRLDFLSEWRDGIKELWDQPGEEYSRNRFRAGLPVPVYSCWNGMLAMTSVPFLTTDPAARYGGPSDRARKENWGRTRPLKANEPARFRTALNSEGECAASECKTLARDFWTRGYDRWMIVPTVRTTYDLATYTHLQLVKLASLQPAAASNLSLTAPLPSSTTASAHLDLDPSASPLSERIPWRALAPPQRILCFGWARGFHIDFEWWRATWEKPFASIRFVKWVDGAVGRWRA